MILGVIPARFESSRFPGKPLVKIGDLTMIQRVYKQVQKAQLIDEVIVATDSKDIADNILEIGGNIEMTRSDHGNGTSRCAEVAERTNYDFIVNIQGDEPFISPAQIDEVSKMMMNGAEIGTLKKRISSSDELLSENTVKVVTDLSGRALYFSRHPIPYWRGEKREQWAHTQEYFKHIGIYGFSKITLLEVTKMKKSALEEAEALEQLRWMENGKPIMVKETKHDSIGIDTPEDLEMALKLIDGKG